ncbi:MAG: ABC transporter ATP-binding protein/permease [Defluviitaleaceae bacterium]|nr:ABC transporter ATP-binding protein/permease [Defluviitaleaceae bacterium]
MNIANIRAVKWVSQYSKWYFHVMIFGSLVNNLLPFVNIFMSAQIVDEIATQRRIDSLITLVAITLLLNIVIGLLSALATRLDKYTREKLNLGQLTANLSKILDSDYERLENGEIMGAHWHIWQASRINGLGIEAMLRSCKTFVDNAINIVLSIFGLSSIIFVLINDTAQINGLAWLLFLVAMIGFFVIVSFRNAKTLTKLGEEIMTEGKKQNIISDIFNRVSSYQAGKEYRIYDMKKIISEYRQKKLDVIKQSNIKYSRGLRNTKIPEVVISGAINFSIYAFVGVNALMGVFGIGSVVLYVGFIGRFVSAIKDIAANISEFRMNNIFLTNFLNYYQENKTIYQGTSLINKDSHYEIEFHNVSYKYSGSNTYALKNVNLKIPCGKKLAVVGMNGSGKTTMIKLLCRLYDPTDGVITLNGIDIRDYDFAEYMDLFSVVFQDFQLFAFSLGQNISASMEYDPIRAEQNLAMVGFGERYNKMPKKLDTPIYKDFEQDGVEISGGEAQKIAMARALYKNAPFIILDEPTAALDPIAEFEIYTKFNEIVNNKTAIYISHRLSSCRFCDDIIVFHEGEILQRGNHSTLILDKDKKYFELWNAQAQYYLG